MNETELHEDAVPVNNRDTESRRREQRGDDNRISNRELFEHHPHYPRKVSEEPLEPHELIHFVFVYAKNDYEPFSSFLELVKEILGTIENGDTVTYETHDSELFPGQHDDNVHDICERAMFILPFLSSSFCCDRMLRFFTSEAIGRTRLDSTCTKGALENTIKKQKKYAVRPIHTADPQSGTYRIPTGLTMTKGIDFYSKDKHMGYVKNQVIGIIKEAIRKFDERKAAMVNALTGGDQLLETFEPPPTEPNIGSSLHENTAAPALMQNEYGIQEHRVGNMGLGENLTLITESVAAEADENTSLADNMSSNTQENMHLKDEALSNDETLKTRKALEDNTVNLLAEERNVCIEDRREFIPPMSQNDTSLEIDTGPPSHDTEIIKTFKTAKDQDRNSKDNVLNDGYCVRKDPVEVVMTNYMSYAESDVPNVAKATQGNNAQKELKDKQPEESPRKKGETVIVINNCKVVQIGERSAIHTRGKRNDVQKNSANHETSLNDLSLSTQSSGSETSWNNFSLTESFKETRTKMLTIEDTYIKGFGSRDSSLFADNIPSDVSHTSQKCAQSSHGVREAEEHDEGPEEPGSDTNYFLDGQLNDPSMEPLLPFRDASTVFSEPVIHLCKNTTKRYGSLDSGYHNHFRHIYGTNLPSQLEGEQDDDDVD